MKPLATLTLAALCLLAGCAIPYTPRPADVAQPGEIRLALYGAAYSAASGIATYERDESGVEESTRGNAESALHPGMSTIILRSLSLEGHAAFGILPGLEAGVILGTSRMGAEARVQLLDERRAPPVSLALSAAGGYVPLFQRDRPFARVAMDVSRRHGQLTWSANPALSWSAETHVMPLGLSSDYAGARNPRLRASARMTRDDLRLIPALGLTWHPQRVERITLEHGTVLADTGLRINAGIVPWITLAHSEPRNIRCAFCSDVSVLDAGVDWGALIVVGLSTDSVRFIR